MAWCWFDGGRAAGAAFRSTAPRIRRRSIRASDQRASTAGERPRIIGAASGTTNSSWLRWRGAGGLRRRASGHGLSEQLPTRQTVVGFDGGASGRASSTARRCKPFCGARAAVNVRGSSGVPLRLGRPGWRGYGTGRRRAGGSGGRQDRNST